MQTTLQDLHGMYVGDLNASELDIFNQGVHENRARRRYVGGAGFLGIAKVVVLDREEHTSNSLAEEALEDF